MLEALLDDHYDIAHDYRPADYDADVEGQMVARSVACEFGAADPVAEAIWVQRCADSGVGPSGFVAGVDLTADSVGDVLSRYRDLPVVRGVRQPLYWAADPLRRLGARPDFLSDARWLRGFERVAEQGLTWDLLVYDEQIPQAHELLRSFPQTPVVLEAVGWPLDLSAEGFKRWADRLEAVSGFANVALKLQGLALLFGPSREAIEPWVRRALATFGPARCMFATHLPVDGLLWSVEELLDTLLAVLGHLARDEQHRHRARPARRPQRRGSERGGRQRLPGSRTDSGGSTATPPRGVQALILADLAEWKGLTSSRSVGGASSGQLVTEAVAAA